MLRPFLPYPTSLALTMGEQEEEPVEMVGEQPVMAEVTPSHRTLPPQYKLLPSASLPILPPPSRLRLEWK